MGGLGMSWGSIMSPKLCESLKRKKKDSDFTLCLSWVQEYSFKDVSIYESHGFDVTGQIF